MEIIELSFYREVEKQINIELVRDKLVTSPFVTNELQVILIRWRCDLKCLLMPLIISCRESVIGQHVRSLQVNNETAGTAAVVFPMLYECFGCFSSRRADASSF